MAPVARRMASGGPGLGAAASAREPRQRPKTAAKPRDQRQLGRVKTTSITEDIELPRKAGVGDHSAHRSAAAKGRRTSERTEVSEATGWEWSGRLQAWPLPNTQTAVCWRKDGMPAARRKQASGRGVAAAGGDEWGVGRAAVRKSSTGTSRCYGVTEPPSEAESETDAHVAAFLPDAWIVHRDPVLESVAVGVLEVRAARASRLRVVDEVLVAHLVHEGIGERAEGELVDVLRVEQIARVGENRQVLSPHAEELVGHEGQRALARQAARVVELGVGLAIVAEGRRVRQARAVSPQQIHAPLVGIAHHEAGRKRVALVPGQRLFRDREIEQSSLRELEPIVGIVGDPGGDRVGVVDLARELVAEALGQARLEAARGGV